jgi:hypothetical protein
VNKHSNISPVVKLAKQLYDECPTVKPTWDQLVASGATQSVWIERAEKLMTMPLMEVK